MRWLAAGGFLLAALGIASSASLSWSAEYWWFAVALAATAATMLLPARARRWAAAATLAVAMLVCIRVAWSRVGGPLGADYGALVLLAVSMGAAAPSAWLGPRHLGLALVPGAAAGVWWLVVDGVGGSTSFLPADALVTVGLGLAAFALLRGDGA
ncbi:MAG: hypothetical protein QOD77_405 [Thermoplasmata archaeon]|jgi:hypothetical protein|nr:hypothetical protein [Thermoplasmata archaeon]